MSIAAAIEAMRAKGIADSDILDIVAHMASAAPTASRSAGAERTRRWRERNASQNVTVTSPGVTTAEPLPPPVSPLFPSPTPLTQNPPLSPTIPAEDADASEFALDGELLLPIAKPKPPPSPTRGCRIPPGFPGDEQRVWFRQDLRLTDDQFDECAAEFRDFWSGVPGHRGVKCDWPATFRNAARKYAARCRPRQAYPSGNQRQDGGMLGAYQRAAARVRAQNDAPRERPGVFDRGNGELEMRYGIPAE